MADNKLSFLLDLDVKEFTEKGLQAQGVVKDIGSESNLAGLLGAFDKMLPILAAGTLAFEGMKKAVDFTLEGEEIKRINDQFEKLSKTAGISGIKLKEGLETAAKGLVDTDTLLKAANESMIKVGSASERLPELMAIAAKASQVYGGTAEENFRILNQALNEGNVGLLKRYGLTVDLKAAQRDFAAQQGVTIDQLSEMGKKQAIFNAALDAGTRAFSDIEVDTKSATNTLEILKTTLSDLKQIFVTVFEKTMGPSVRAMLQGFQGLVSYVKTNLVSVVGDESEKAAAKLKLASDKLKEMQEDLVKLEEKKGTWKDFAPAETQSRIQALTSSIQRQQDVVNELEISNKKLQKAEQEKADQESENRQKRSNENLIDEDKREKQHAAANAAIAKADEDLFKLQQANIESIEQINSFVTKQREIENQNFAARTKSINSSLSLDADQKLKLLQIEEQTHHQKLRILENDTAKFRQKLLHQYVANSNTAFKGISNAFIANSQQMKLEQQDFGKRGEEMWNSLSTNATAAFTQMGADMARGKDIGQATADALRGVFLGMLGDRAIAEGQILLLSSIFPPNPLGLTAGAGLLALGGALKAVAGSSGAPTTAAAGPSPQAVASGSAPKLQPISSSAVETQTSSAEALASTPQETAVPEMERQQRAQRTVSIHIAGNYLETDQTKRMLMDLMRQETDATGFNYSQIGA